MHLIPEHPYRIRMGSNAVYLLVRLEMLRDALNVPFIWIWPRQDNLMCVRSSMIHMYVTGDLTWIERSSDRDHLLPTYYVHGERMERCCYRPMELDVALSPVDLRSHIGASPEMLISLLSCFFRTPSSLRSPDSSITDEVPTKLCKAVGRPFRAIVHTITRIRGIK